MTALDFFATHPVFTRDEFARTRTSSPRTVDSLLRQHVERGRLLRVRRGLYASVPFGASPDPGAVDPYLVASKAAPDAVISHHAALQFHGRAYSLWPRFTFLTAAASRPFSLGGFTWAPVRPPAEVVALADFGGGVVTVAHAGGTVRVTTLERTMVDLFHAPDLGGDWEEIWRSLEQVDFFDLDAVIAYALALGTASTMARVGYFLEQHRETLFVEDRHLAQLEAHAPAQARYFDARRTPGRWVPRWRLFVPEVIADRRWEEAS
jgi:predicted transcriptional regulator of viral defense system